MGVESAAAAGLAATALPGAGAAPPGAATAPAVLPAEPALADAAPFGVAGFACGALVGAAGADARGGCTGVL